MTSSNEVIAIEGAGDRRNPDNLRFKTNFKPKKQFKHYPYFVDPSIVPRVKQYLEDNKDKVYVDIDEMVTELQLKYRDYAKRKRSVFKGLVEKAFSVVLKTYSMHDNDTSRDGDEADSSSDMDIDSEDVDLIVEPNTSNNQVMNMYMQQQAIKKRASAKPRAVNDGAKELIDISSDDDDEDDEQTPAKRSKNAETSNPSDPLPTEAPSSQTHKPTNGQATQEEVAVAQEKVTTNSAVTAAPAPPSSAQPAVPERLRRKRTTVDGASGSSAPVNGEVSKRRRREIPILRPCCSFKDVGGCSAVLQEVCKLLVHLRHPEIFEQIGVTPPRGFLLHGPPGCGKTLLANAIAGELDVPLLKVSAPELVAGVSGESEERIRDLFDQAASIAPCVLFLDEIDAITPNRNNAQREMERRIVAQLLTTLDELGEKEGGNQVLVVGATNRPDSLDPALRRAGRFDREVCMGIPDREARIHILRVVCGRLALAPEVSSDAGIGELASLTPGFVGADLAALTREAAMVAVNRIFAQIQEKTTEKQDTSDGKETSDNENKDTLKNSENVVGEVTAEPQEGAVVVSQEVMDTTEEIQTPVPSEQRPENALDASEIVSLDGTEKPQAVAEVSIDESEKNKESENIQTPEAENDGVNDKEEVAPLSEDKGDDPSPQIDACLPVQVEDVEIIPQNVSNNVVSDSGLPQDKLSKTDDDVEVLEVQMVNCSDQTSSKDQTVENSVSAGTTELALSQKLMPMTLWSPELCQLMSWLKEVPPLTATQLNELTITMSDFHEALHHVQPSSKREGFATVPGVTWDDVGSLANVRAELQLSVLAPVRYAKQFSQLGLNAPAGVLLCGPPGCGKTLLAKAVANEAGINFISVKGPELLNMYVGESERAVRQVFQRARNSAPCVIFFDELDALCPKRSDSGDNGVSSRVVNQLLTEMDGVEGRAAVFLMAASNRPDIIDPAVLRPGRLDKVVYVGLPNAEDRKDILRAVTKNGTRPLLSSDVNLSEIASRPQLEGYSGADLAALVREAGVEALREFIGQGGDLQTGPLCVSAKHFNAAVSKIIPSVTSKARKHYEKLQEKYSNASVEEKPMIMDTA